VNKKGLSFEFDVAQDMPSHLKGDPYRLNQVLINIIGNAIKFTEKGSVVVRISVKHRDAEHITLSFVVADTGIGIPGQSQPHIFESFSQAGQDITRRFGGTGLGLAICNQLLKLQGGSIAVASMEGQGSTFSFEIPYEYSQQGFEIAPAALRINDYTQQMKGIRFLVVEDNEINQQLVDHVLRKAGAAVTIANNGEEAIACLQKDPTYDCIIMDLQMPVMDGYAATQHIRTVMHLQTPIIAMTATALIGEQLRCVEVGMNDYMTKPFEFADLYRRVAALLESRASLAK
jgi:CheY-like chemotaxis protein